MVQEAREGLAVPAVRIISAFLSRDREGAGAHDRYRPLGSVSEPRP